LGVHVTPVHYYQPIPDSRRLDGEMFSRRTELVGVDLRPAAQLVLLEELAASWSTEYNQLPSKATGPPSRFHQAFLTGNHDFEVLLGAHWLPLEHPKLLRAAIPSYDPAATMPGSFWMRRVT
jgi:hypothetical protein